MYIHYALYMGQHSPHYTNFLVDTRKNYNCSTTTDTSSINTSIHNNGASTATTKY